MTSEELLNHTKKYADGAFEIYKSIKHDKVLNDREKCNALTSITAILLHNIGMDYGTDSINRCILEAKKLHQSVISKL